MLENVWEVLKPFNDPVNFVGSIVGIAGAGISLLVYRRQRNLEHTLKEQEARGDYFPHIRAQRHGILVQDETAVLSIVGLGQARLDQLVLGSGKPEAIQRAARKHPETHAIFRMPTVTEQNHVYRDLVGWAGALIKDGIPRIMTVFCEKGHGVERFLLRAALYTPGELATLRGAEHVTNPAGKETEWPRVSASLELADAVGDKPISEVMPVLTDPQGFIIAHWIVPAG